MVCVRGVEKCLLNTVCTTTWEIKPQGTLALTPNLYVVIALMIWQMLKWMPTTGAFE